MNGFDEFWEHYPRRVAKKAARVAYERALELTDAETLRSGAEAYAYAMKGKEHRYVCHAATWLNQERWEDEHEVKCDDGWTRVYSADKFRRDKDNVVRLK